MASGRSDVVGIGLDRIESEQVVNAQATINALAKQFVRFAKLGDTSPSVMNVERLEFRNTAPLTVVAFDEGQNGQRIELLGDGNTTIQNNAKIVTASGADLLLDPGVVFTFTRFTDGVWHQSAGGGGGGGGGGGVTTFAGRSGAVVPVAGDYTPAFIGAVPVSHLTDADPHSQYEFDSNKGAASGYAPLDASSKVPLANLPAGVVLPAWVNYHPDNPPASPTLFGGVNYDLEFVRDNVLVGGTVIGAPAFTPVIVDRALKIVSGTSGSADFKGVEFASPIATAFTVTCKMRRRIWIGTFGAGGLALRRNASGAGNFVVFYSSCATPWTATNLEVDKYTTVTARSSAGSGGNFGGALAVVPVYMRWVYNGTNITCSVSFSGWPDSYVDWFTETAATFLGGAPGRIILGIDNFGSLANVVYFEWVRFT